MEHKEIKIGSDRAVMHAYLLEIDRKTDKPVKRPAVLIFPGGSYETCSPWEDEPIALAFMAEGYQAFTLYYSVAESEEDQVFPRVLNEAEEALRTIRLHAEDWNVDPHKVAVIGFSAGGHLAACVSSMGKEKPDASILGYSRILGSAPEEIRFIPNAAEAVDRNTPPAFIFGTREDEAVGPSHGMAYAEALQKHHVLYEIHYFEHGGHGMNLGKSWTANGYAPAYNPVYSVWFKMCIEWLKLHFGDFNLRLPKNFVRTSAAAMDMPLEYLLEDKARKEILFETVRWTGGLPNLKRKIHNLIIDREI